MRLIKRTPRRDVGPCPAWEQSVYLSVSGDLPPRAARALDRHFRRCFACRQAAARARRARELCVRASGSREDWPVAEGTWDRLQARIEAGRREDVSTPRIAWSRPRPILVPAFLAAAAAAAAFLVLPLLFDRTAGDGAPRSAVESHWSQKWEEFASGSDRPDINLDPFAPEIPNPDVIDF